MGGGCRGGGGGGEEAAKTLISNTCSFLMVGFSWRRCFQLQPVYLHHWWACESCFFVLTSGLVIHVVYT